MSEFIDSLRESPMLADGAMGSYLFRRTGRLSERNHVYEALNEDNPELIRDVHFSYLRAGARCLTTNTFGANLLDLGLNGEEHRVAELNRAAVRLARAAIASYGELSGTTETRFVFGSVGPCRTPWQTPDEIGPIYGAQVEALLDEGVDALLLETFSSLRQVRELMEYISRSFGDLPPVITGMSLQYRQDGGWSENPVEFVETMSDLGAAVVGINCCAPWDAQAFVTAVESLDCVRTKQVLISAMPNAGGFQRIGNRFMTQVNPEFMGRLARTLAEKGVNLLGGCCEVHPHHLREMYNFLHGYLAGGTRVEVGSLAKGTPAGDAEKRGNGPFSRKVKDGEFAVSVEILPSRGTSPAVLQRKVDFVRELAASGLADALDITDGSRGIPLMPPGDFVSVVRGALEWTAETGDGLEFIPHFTTRDLNVMGLQSRMIGLHARRINNVLFITGDPPKMSPTYPRSTAVFDVNSVAMVRLTHSGLNAGLDFGGEPLARDCDGRTHFTIGTGFEPEALDRDRELDKLRAKIEAGADYLLTQPAFRPEPLAVLEPFRGKIPILAGVLILTGLDHARRIGEVPGVVIPEEIYRRLARYPDRTDQAKVGIEMAAEQVEWVRKDGWSGLYLMSPAALSPVIEVLKAGLA